MKLYNSAGSAILYVNGNSAATLMRRILSHAAAHYSAGTQLDTFGAKQFQIKSVSQDQTR